MRYFIAAYTLAPSGRVWNPELESEYFSGLKNFSNLYGLEVPVVGALHAHDKAWFLDNIDPSWQFVFTGMPGVMEGISANPHYGIASNDESGRKQSLDFYRQTQLAVLELNEALGRESVESVQLHTAPNRTRGKASSSALKKSLKQMACWDWGGASLVVEHCDAMISGQQPQKGFLGLEEEVQTIKSVNADSNLSITLALNWGRSAIETRDVKGPIEHIDRVKADGLLYGLTFSGVSDQEGAYGAWKDTHMPPASAFDLEHFAQGSLLTADEMVKSLVASDYQSLPFLGLKIGGQPNLLSINSRLACYQNALSMLDSACAIAQTQHG